MDTATAIAIAAPNAVAATAIVVGWLQHGKALEAQRELGEAGFEHQRELADLDNVRAVLDAAAVTLHRVAYALDSVRLNLSQFGAGFLEDEKGAAAYEELKVAGQDVDVLTERLAVRFGRKHEVVLAFAGAGEATLEVFRSVDRLKLAPARDGDERAQRYRFELGNRTRDEVAAQRATFDARREELMDAARRAAGAELSTLPAADGD